MHPIQAESVAWATERKNLLSGFFYLSSFLLYLEFLDSRKARRYGLSLLAFAAALLSKIVTLTLAPTLLFWEALRERSIRAKSLIRVSAFFVLGGAVAVMTALLETYRYGAERAEWSYPLAARVLVAPRVLLFYISKILFPVHMSFLYPRWKIDPSDPSAYWPVALFAALLAILWWRRKRIPTPGWFGLGHYVMTLLPASGLVSFFFLRYSFVQDHFQYLAGLGIMIVIALAGAEAVKRIVGKGNPGEVGRHVAAAVLVGCGLLTFHECPVYRSEETLWRDTIEKNPRAWLAYNNLGKVFAKQGRGQEGERCFRKALEIEPDFAEAGVNLGLADLRRGGVDGAIASLEAAIALRPDYAIAHRNLGEAYFKKRMYDEAIAECRTALAVEPNHEKSYVLLGAAYYGKGMADEAAEAYRRAIEIRPGDAVVHCNFGLLHRGGGARERARVGRHEVLLEGPAGRRAGGAGQRCTGTGPAKRA